MRQKEKYIFQIAFDKIYFTCYYTNMSKDNLEWLRNGEELSTPQVLNTIIVLSIPAILSQITNVAMQYCDASTGLADVAEKATIRHTPVTLPRHQN